MKKHLLIACLVLISFVSTAQEEQSPQWKQKIYGYVKNDIFRDSRHTVNSREGHYLLWPSPQLLDSAGNDLNSQASFNMLAIQSRLGTNFSGPNIRNARISGTIEADFFGNSNTAINSLRLRHAFMKLSWEKAEIISGQYWHPFTIIASSPTTISFNSGVPFAISTRCPQIRYSYTQGLVSFIGALASQLDNSTRGILGTPDSEQLKHAQLPEVHAQIHYNRPHDSLTIGLQYGAGVSYKSIVPRTFYSSGEYTHKVKERMQGFSAILYTAITTKHITCKLQGIYGENITELTQPGGFAIRNIKNQNPQEFIYTPLQTGSYWIDIQTNGTTWKYGIFGGYLENYGSKHTMLYKPYQVYGLATNIAKMYRVSPRVSYTYNKFTVGGELEYSVAFYGDNYNNKHKAKSLTSADNMRILVNTAYAF